MRLSDVAEVTRSGWMFILRSRDRKPMFGVEERVVPMSDVPGEEAGLHSPFH